MTTDACSGETGPVPFWIVSLMLTYPDLLLRWIGPPTGSMTLCA